MYASVPRRVLNITFFSLTLRMCVWDSVLLQLKFLAQTPLRTIFLSHVGGLIISSSSEEVLILPRAEHDEHYRASTHSLKVCIHSYCRFHHADPSFAD